MKIRTDFVTNSSSSGFVAINVKSDTLDELLKKARLDKSVFAEVEGVDGGGIGVPWAIKPDVALSLCRLLLYGLPSPSSEEYEGIWEEVHDEFIDCEYSSYSDISRLINDALEMASENESEEDTEEDQQFIGVLNLIKLICKSREQINADATAKISSGTVMDEGELDISYASIDVKDGNGTYTKYDVNDGDDLEYDDTFFGEVRFFEEIADSYPDAKRIKIGEGKI